MINQAKNISHIDMTDNHQKNFAIIYNIFEQEMHELAKMQSCKDRDEKWQEEWNKKFGAKETPLSVGMKILNSFNKVISMENKVIEIKVKPEDSFERKSKEKCQKETGAKKYYLNTTSGFTPPQNVTLPAPGILDGNISNFLERCQGKV